MYTFLKSIQDLWLKILYSIDEQEKYNISHEIYKKLTNKYTLESISILYKNIKTNECKYLLMNIHNLQLLVEEYIKEASYLFTFFRLSNVIKLKDNIDVSKYNDIIINVIKKEDEEFDESFEFEPNRIKLLMDIFYAEKTRMFENSFKHFNLKIKGKSLV